MKKDFNKKLEIENYNCDPITKFRRQSKIVKLRHICFWLISKDFFNMERMFKYGIVNSDKCQRYGDKETYNLCWGEKSWLAKLF